MTDEKKPASVTRGELYPILANIYLLIAVALLTVIPKDSTSTHVVWWISILPTIGYFTMFGMALSLSIWYRVLARRERGR